MDNSQLVNELYELSRMMNSPVVMESLAIASIEIDMLTNKINALQDRLSMIHNADDENVWYWQGNGEDYIESMCSGLKVVIRADQLRDLIDGSSDKSVYADAMKVSLATLAFDNAMKDI